MRLKGNKMDEKVVVVRHLNGDLAYTGLMIYAASRLNLSESKLTQMLFKNSVVKIQPYAFGGKSYGPYTACLKELDFQFGKSAA